MLLELEPVEALRAFFERGGNVLLWIAAVTFLMWFLIIDRVWYFWTFHPK